LRELPAIVQQQDQAFKEEKLSLQNGGVFTAGKGRVFTAELRLKLGPIRQGFELVRVRILW
jgi:hypothetical protein